MSGGSMARRLLIISWLLGLLAWTCAIPALADEPSPLGQWSPQDVLQGRFDSVSQEAGSAVIEPRSCAPRWDEMWTHNGAYSVQVTLRECANERVASELPKVALTVESATAVESTAFGNRDIAWVENGDWMIRYWAQGNLVVMAAVHCRGDVACPESSEEIARSLSSQLPGQVLQSRDASASTINYMFVSVLSVWTVFVLMPRFVIRLVEPRLRFPASPPWFMNIGPDIARARWKRAGRLVLVWVMGILVLRAVGSLSPYQRWTIPVVLLCLGLIVAAYLGRKRLNDPIFHTSASTRGASGGRRWMGRAVTGLAWIIAALVIGGLVFGLLLLSVIRFGLGGGGVDAEANAGVLSLLAVGGLLVVGLLDLLSRRLRARSARDAMLTDQRPPILFLRSFDEDRLKMKASLSRLGVLEHLSPWRRRRFEDVMVRQLGRFGPVVAISPPGTVLPPIGAARMTLSNDEWQGRVAELASGAAAVVISATPASVREGFEWEMELIATRIGHERVILVIPPRRPKVVAERWAGFLTAAARWRLFWVLSAIPLPTGTHLITYAGDGNWRFWGCRRRWDWSYAVAIDRAFRAALEDWGAARLRTPPSMPNSEAH